MSKLDELVIELINQDELGGYYGDNISDVAKESLKAFILELIDESKPKTPEATSWQKGIEARAFKDATRVYEHKLQQKVKEL